MTDIGDHRRSGARRGAGRSAAIIGTLIGGALSGLAGSAALAGPESPTFAVVADGIPQPLVAGDGDAVRGRALVVARESANCVLCHAVPDPAVRFSGNVGPSLAGIGSRMTTAQLRLRIADNARVSPASVMPSYYRTAGLDRVAVQYAGKPILSASEVEDLVAYLSTLR